MKYVSGKQCKDVVSLLLCAHGNEVMVFIKNNLINFFNGNLQSLTEESTIGQVK